MQALVGRLTALDPDASETLKVITYFDALIAGHGSIEVLLRGAAILSGCAAGFESEGGRYRVSAAGLPEEAPPAAWPSHAVGPEGSVWIERVGLPHTNDEMILERLAFGVLLASERSPAGATRRALETLLTTTATPTDRREAARRLALERGARYRILAAPGRARLGSPNIARDTEVGLLRATLVPEAFAEPAQSDGPVGVGWAVDPDSLAESWGSAVVALRLTDSRRPIVKADELGGYLLVAQAVDAGDVRSPDLDRLRELTSRQPTAVRILHALAHSESLRAAASELGLHHSTVQARVAEFGHALQFDLRGVEGRTRLALVLAIDRLLSARFE